MDSVSPAAFRIISLSFETLTLTCTGVDLLKFILMEFFDLPEYGD